MPFAVAAKQLGAQQRNYGFASKTFPQQPSPGPGLRGRGRAGC